MLETAAKYTDLGLSVIPIEPGKKKPRIKWAVHQERVASQAELKRWFDEEIKDNRLAVVTGQVSGGLEIIDFDDDDAFQEYKRVVNEIDPELNSIAARCPVVRSAGGGYHLYYRIEWVDPQPFPGNRVLAADEEGRTLIETRAEGGYALAPPSPGYEELHLSLADIPLLTLEERERLHVLAKSFNRKIEEFQRYHGAMGEERHGHKRPGDDFNERGDIRDVLTEAGWEQVGANREVTLWTRPGSKSRDPHATLGVGGNPIFYVFSTNASPFRANTAYSYFSVYAILRHRSDFSAASADLAAQGYGDPLDEGVTITTGSEFERILPITAHVLPLFPLDVLPPWAKEYVDAVALSTQTPVDLAALLALTTAAACLAKRVEVLPREDWAEPVNLYTVCALPPGSRKSAAFSLIAKPLLDHERRNNRDMSLQIAEAGDKLDILKGQIDAIKKNLSKATDENGPELAEKLRQLREQLAEHERVMPREERLVADDVTPEKLASLLSQYGGRMAVLSADTDVFGMMAGKYNGQLPNLDVYLKGHAGDDLKVDRVGREPDYVEKPALTLGLAVQPEVLQGLIKKPGFRGRGIIGRWLYSLPEDRIGYRSFHTPSVDPVLAADYRAKIQALADTEPKVDEFGQQEPILLRFAADAGERYWSWAETIEHRQRPGGDLQDLKDWASKLHGLVARIAALLHVLGGGKGDAHITYETLEKALDVGEYATYHAKAAFQEMGADRVMSDARRILDYVMRSGRESFKGRDIQQQMITSFPKAEDLEAPLKLLKERGYIAVDGNVEAKSVGRKPSPRYLVNPLLWDSQREEGVRQLPFAEFMETYGRK
jgi:replicative DNA helicase